MANLQAPENRVYAESLAPITLWMQIYLDVISKKSTWNYLYFLFIID